MEARAGNRKIALIGSFRRHFAEIQQVLEVLERAGWTVTSPARSEVLDVSVEFVRLASDLVHDDDAMIQSRAMSRILSADVVLVVAPNGYVGKTTSYEIGRLVQAKRPIYFTEMPQDLPIYVHESRILDASDLCRQSSADLLVSLHQDAPGDAASLERGMLCESS